MNLPSEMKELYKTVWEIKQRMVLDTAAYRGAYIDQSQSLNIRLTDATTAQLSSMQFQGWQLLLRTGIYYLRTKAASDTIKFTAKVDKLKSVSATPAAGELAPEQHAIERLKGRYEVTKVAAQNLNNVIDRNYYPIPDSRQSIRKHRPVGIGVQGLADASRCCVTPSSANLRQQLIVVNFETIYFPVRGVV